MSDDTQPEEMEEGPLGAGAVMSAPMDWDQLGEIGLVWLINASVLHPRGLALMTDSDTPGTVQIIAGTPDEPIAYGEAMFDLITERFKAWQEFEADLKTSAEYAAIERARQEVRDEQA